MPEGDTIFRAAARMEKALGGRVVTRFETALAQLSRVDFDHPIAGRTIEKVFARGKHLLIGFSGDLFLRTHMKMSGSWHLYRPGERWQSSRADMRVVLETDSFVAVGFRIPVAEFHTAASLPRQGGLSRIGPDLLAADFDVEDALARLRNRKESTLSEALLNQRVVAGIGNVFRSEVLFVTGIHPHTRIDALSTEDLQQVLAAARKLMAMNVGTDHPGSITTYTALRRTTGRSDPEGRLWAYGRGGEPCRRCGTSIEYTKQGIDARGVYWCPNCQPPR